MDIYQILTTYNYIWSMKEILITLLIIATTITSVLFLYRKKRIKSSQAITILVLIAFLLIVLGSTVFGRIPGLRRYELLPLWSYGEIFRGNVSILKEVLLNFVLLMPVGVILVFVVDRRLSWKVGLIVGVFISSTIELLQLITCRGLLEFDDILHNSIGCMIGWVVCGQVRKWIENK